MKFCKSEYTIKFLWWFVFLNIIYLFYDLSTYFTNIGELYFCVC